MGQGLSRVVEGSSLCEAVVQNDLDVVNQIIQAYPHAVLYKTVVKRRTPLMLASGAGSVDCLLKILWTTERMLHGTLYQQHIDQMDSKGNTALLLASKHGHSACSRLLLDDSANPLLANIRGDTALHLAANRGHASCVDLLLQGWVRGHDGFPVRAASVMVTDASGEGRYIDCHNKSGLAPLHLAVLGGNVETALALLRNGASPEIPVLRGYQLRQPFLCGGSTPLHIAAFKGNARMCVVLLDAHWRQPGIGLCRLRNARGLTPLNCALLGGHHGLARIIVESRIQSPLLALSRRALNCQFPEALRQHLLSILRRAQLLVQLRELSQHWKNQGLAKPSDDSVKMIGLAELRPDNIARLEELVRRDGSSLRDIINGLEEAFAAPTGRVTTPADPADNGVLPLAARGSVIQEGAGNLDRASGSPDAEEGTEIGDVQGSIDARRGRNRRRQVNRTRGRAGEIGTATLPSSHISTSSEVDWTLLEGQASLRIVPWGVATLRRRRGRNSLLSSRHDDATLPQTMLHVRRSPIRTEQSHHHRQLQVINHRQQTLSELMESAEAALASGAAGVAAQRQSNGAGEHAVVELDTVEAGNVSANLVESRFESSNGNEESRMRATNLGGSAEGDMLATRAAPDLASHSPAEVECAICFDGVSDVMMVQCGHGMCFVCACKMMARCQDPQCPFCRGNIQSFTLKAGARVHCT